MDNPSFTFGMVITIEVNSFAAAEREVDNIQNHVKASLSVTNVDSTDIMPAQKRLLSSPWLDVIDLIPTRGD